MAGRSMISLGGQCWVRKLITTCYPDQEGQTGVFDWLGTTPSMVAHILSDDFQTLCNPDMYRPVGKKSGHFQNRFYEHQLRNQLNHFRLSITDMGLDDGVFSADLPPLFRHNTEEGVQAMCETIRRRAERMDSLLLSWDFKVLVWGVAIPYNHYIFAKQRQVSIEEILQVELRILFECLINLRHVENFCLVGLIVIHNVPEEGMVVDKVYAVSEPIRDTYVTMKRCAVTSQLHGAKWTGWHWAVEQSRICSFLDSCEDLMCACQAPSPSSVPPTKLAAQSSQYALVSQTLWR